VPERGHAGAHFFVPFAKELAMPTTMNPNIAERRHIPDRRATVLASTPASASQVSDVDMEDTSAMNAIDWIAMTLLIIGGLNWGLVGLFHVDLVATLFGEGSALSRAVYTIVGLSALYSIYTTAKISRE